MIRIIKAFLLFCFLIVTVAPDGHDLLVASAYATPIKSSAGKPLKNNSRKGKQKASKTLGPGDLWERIRNGIRIQVPNPAAGLEDLAVSRMPITSTLTAPIEEADKTVLPGRRLTSIITPKKTGPAADSQLIEKLRVKHVLNPYKKGAMEQGAEPEDRYTKLGRLKLGAKEKLSSLYDKLKKKTAVGDQEKSENARSDTLFKSATSRIRTRLGLNSEGKSGTEPDAKIKAAVGKNPSITVSQNPQPINNCSDQHKQEIINLAKKGILSSAYRQILEQCRNKQISINERIARQMGSYSRGYLFDISERARPFLYHIVDTLSKNNLPLDLALLPIVESAFKPTALSPASAAGIWQFIPSTGRIYGLEQNGFYDARLDITASTHAAIRFLSELRDRYKGDWLLALAAYNAGPGTVDAAIAQNRELGFDTDYWSLPLPAETQNYVPRLLALARIFANPAASGLKLRPLKNEPYFIKVKIDRAADINQLMGKSLVNVAKLANYDQGEFGMLNSAFLKPELTKSMPLSFNMPIANANLLHRSLDFMANFRPVEEEQWPFYHELGFSSKAITTPFVTVALNDVHSNPSSLKLASANADKDSENKDKLGATIKSAGIFTVHYLDKGETLKTLADYHGLTETLLREANNLKRRDNLALGQRLLIPLTEMAISSVSKSRSSILFRGFH